MRSRGSHGERCDFRFRPPGASDVGIPRASLTALIAHGFVGWAACGALMGGDLAAKPDSAKAPTFAVQALKDPESGNLDRIQIIKGWVERGKAKERIYDVALSDGRKVNPKTRKAPPVGNTVDVENASYTNDIGDSQLSIVWTDPHFNPKQRAVYYVRVPEIPTPRWSTYDAKKLGVEPPKGLPTTIQERAWSSPIWDAPAAPSTANRNPSSRSTRVSVSSSGFPCFESER